MNSQATLKIDEELRGEVAGITYRNEDNGYSVLRVRVSGVERIVVGVTPDVRVGEWVHATGTWQDSKFGRQFKADTLVTSLPSSYEGIRKFLASGAIPGIGPAMAERLVQAFGDKVFDVAEKEPNRLATVEGIGAKRATAIAEALANSIKLRNMLTWLYQHGLSPGKAMKIIETYGEDKAIDIVKQQPYRLADDIHGIGFAQADRIAASLGFRKHDKARLMAGVYHVVNALTTQAGYCGLTREHLLDKAMPLLEVKLDEVENALNDCLSENKLVQDVADSSNQPCVFLPEVYQAERDIAANLLRLSKGTGVASGHSDEYLRTLIQQAEATRGVTLDVEQRNAVFQSLRNNISVVTGGPGTGKTTTIGVLLESLRQLGVMRGSGSVALIAPTGKASRRITESTGYEAGTIHRLLGMKGHGRFDHNRGNPLEQQFIILDEMSMVGVHLMKALLLAVPDSTSLVLIGDPDQLPSIEPGRVLQDILEAKMLPAVRLATLHRQAQQSHIIVAAHAVNSGAMPSLPEVAGEDLLYVPSKGTALPVVQAVKALMAEGLDPFTDIQVISPMRKGEVGIDALNQALGVALNGQAKPHLNGVNGVQYKEGDKVIQLVNDYDNNVFNGDIGKVTLVNVAEKLVHVEYSGSRKVAYRQTDLDAIAHAWAITVHKSQGAESAAIVMVLQDEHYVMLRRNLLYTGITRARKKLILIGSKRAIGMAVKRADAVDRRSKLKHWLTQHVEGQGKTRSAAEWLLDDAA